MSGRSFVRRTWGATLFAAVLSAAPAEAQTRVLEVTNAGGVPLPAAEVTVVFDGFRVQQLVLDPEGRVEFDLGDLAGFRRIHIRHLGLRSEFVYPETLEAVTVVRMVDEAIRIDGITAIVGRESCPAPGTAAGRARMRSVANGYRTTPPLRVDTESEVITDAAVASRLLERPVRRQRTGAIPRLQPDAYADLRRGMSVDRWVAARGLVHWNRYPFVERFLNWAYPRFDGPDAVFFVSAIFVEGADLRLLDSEGGRIGFCYLRDGLQGVIELEGDRIERVSWRFGRTSPDEAAGGYAVFSTDPGFAWLLPEEGLFFRLMSPGNPELYFRQHSRYRGWSADGTYFRFAGGETGGA